METIISNNIKISVRVFYQHQHSIPTNNEYLFVYQVRIENLGTERVKLMKRFWRIFDSNLKYEIVEGDGVVGNQPTLAPGECHQYQSWCPLKSSMGSMSGHYVFRKSQDDAIFEATIPRFQLIAPFKNN